MTKVPKIWMQIAALPTQKKKSTYRAPRAKRTKVQLDDFAKSLGLTIKWHGHRHNNHEICDAEGNSVHFQYGVCDWCCTNYEVEYCLEDYSQNKNAQ